MAIQTNRLNQQNNRLVSLHRTRLHTVAVNHVLNKSGIPLLLMVLAAIAVVPVSHGYKIPKAKVRAKHADKSNPNFLIFVSVALLCVSKHRPQPPRRQRNRVHLQL
mmetsp:Transcript_12506/g.26940  ORF Transcript_12506/g.26940 Transcript_12506/m.26940 type:complete len:106 (-) Transcript_12506:199-516(-)